MGQLHSTSCTAPHLRHELLDLPAANLRLDRRGVLRRLEVGRVVILQSNNSQHSVPRSCNQSDTRG
jgi:hypothetical protein